MKYAALALLTSLCILSPASAETDTNSSTNRPASWAVPVKLKGVPNLNKVSETLYRSAQPSKRGMKELKKAGIKTVINLRSFHSDRDEIAKTDLKYFHIYVKAWHPEEKEVVEFLKIITNPDNTPVLVHCKHGADRTGTMCAIYRMAIEGWTADEAIREMSDGGYNFHSIWANLPTWIRNLNIEEIKKKAGLTVTETKSSEDKKK